MKFTMNADDLLIHLKFKNPANMSEEVSLALNKLCTWLRELGMEVTPNISCCCVFSRSRISFQNLRIYKENTSIRCEATMKYLGIILDRKLTWLPHIKQIDN